MHHAARMGRFNIIKPLMDKGAKVDFPDYVSKDMVTFTCCMGCIHTVTFTCAQQEGCTPLHVAVNYGHEHVVRLMLEGMGDNSQHTTNMQNEVFYYRRIELSPSAVSNASPMLCSYRSEKRRCIWHVWEGTTRSSDCCCSMEPHATLSHMYVCTVCEYGSVFA